MQDLTNKAECTGPGPQYRSIACFGCHKKETQPGVAEFGLFSVFGAEYEPEVLKGLVSSAASLLGC